MTVPTRATIRTTKGEPDKNGNYKIGMQHTLPPDLYDFLYERAGIEKRSPTNIMLRALECYKTKCERLGV